MPVSDVRQSRSSRTTDRKLDLADAKAVLEAAGKSVSADELQEIAQALVPRGQFVVDADARSFLQNEVASLQQLQNQAQMQNREVERRRPGLEREVKDMMKVGVPTKTYGGSTQPEAVKKLMNELFAAGLTPFDVAELDRNPERDEHDATQWALTGKWSPYPQEIAPTGNMSFDYTELTPKKIADDMATERDQRVYKGTITKTGTDFRTGQQMSWQEPQYETVRMKGTGNITSLYDELDHDEPTALGGGPNYPKFASNFAILADGSFHAVPAMRRTEDQQGLILTNPSLARGKLMIWNGHLEMRNGVVTGLGLSGRLQKEVAAGNLKLPNPIKLLEAHGFKIDPNLRVQWEGRGDVKIDPATNLVVAA